MPEVFALRLFTVRTFDIFVSTNIIIFPTGIIFCVVLLGIAQFDINEMNCFLFRISSKACFTLVSKGLSLPIMCGKLSIHLVSKYACCIYVLLTITDSYVVDILQKIVMALAVC